MKHLVALLAAVLCSVAFAAAQERVFVADSLEDLIVRSKLDGSSIGTVLDASDGLSNPQGMAADTENFKIYWTDGTLGTVNRANLDGSSPEAVVTGRTSPRGITLDLVNDKLYWTESPLGFGRIMRANLDGSSPELVFDSLQTGGPIDVAVDAVNGKVYWTNPSLSEIRRADLDGSNSELIFAASGPSGIAVDPAGGKLYFSDTVFGAIERIDLDGSNNEFLVTGLASPRYIALDLVNGKIYFTDAGGELAGRANLDGSALETIIDNSDGLASPSGVCVFGSPAVVNPGTVLEDPPVPVVTNDDVTITMQRFSGASAEVIPGAARTVRAGGLTFRYDVRVQSSSSGDNRKKLSKKNTVTFKNLRPDSYTTKYQVKIFRRRSKTAQEKAKDRGKTGFQAKFRPAGRTDFSPSAGFNIP